MDPTDQTPDVVQPQEGQGGEGQGNPAYAEYLTRIPEEARAPAEEAFKAWDANYTRHQQEAAEYRKSWEPYEQTGVNNYDPQAVQWALQFYEAQQTNPQAVWEWAQQYAQEHGLNAQQTADLQQQLQQSQPEFQDPFQQDQAQQFQQMLQQSLQPLQQEVERMNQWRAQQEEQLAQAEGRRVIEQQLADLEAKHGKFNRDIVESLANKYANTDPMNAISRGFSEYEKWVNELQRSTLQPKVDAPDAPESGGVANAAPEPPQDWGEARARSLEILRQANRAAG